MNGSSDVFLSKATIINIYISPNSIMTSLTHQKRPKTTDLNLITRYYCSPMFGDFPAHFPFVMHTTYSLGTLSR